MPRHKILIVDDDEATARVLARFLHSYDVTLAYDGEQGLERAIETLPDLVITDLWMPRLDGIGMCDAMKHDPSLRCVPVIFLSAVTDAPHIVQAIAAGARRYVQKPVDVEKLLRTVRTILSFASIPAPGA